MGTVATSTTDTPVDNTEKNEKKTDIVENSKADDNKNVEKS